MKSKIWTRIIALALFAAVATPVGVAAQDNATQNQRARHHHYQLIDMGTLGGANSFPPTPYPPPLDINSRGLAIAGAETSIPDPYAPNCFTGECLVTHTITWQNGVQTDLGALPGANNSFPAWVNDHGDVVGFSENSVIDPLTGFPEIIGVLWKDGAILDLGTMGGNASYPNAINNRGQVVGAALNTIPDSNATSFWGPVFPVATQFRAFLWQHGVMRDLGTLGGNDAGAVFVNERGQVSGVSLTNTNNVDTFFWENGKKMVDIGTLGGSATTPWAMNNRGQITGDANTTGDQTSFAFLWDKKRGLQNLGTLPGGGHSSAFWMNDAGEVVGSSDSSDGNGSLVFAVLWKNGAITNLGTVDGDLCSIAKSINSQGQIVGSSYLDCVNETHWFLWENGGPAIDLQNLVPPRSGVTLTNAAFINDRGEIEGFGSLTNGDFHSILLIPCDENHSDVEGCDYGLVEAVAASPTAAPRYLPSGTQGQTQLRRTNRYHILGLQSPSTLPQPDFSPRPDYSTCYNGGNPGICLTLTALSPGTVSPGGTATSTVTLAASGGFYGDVGLSCSVQPSPALAPICSVNGLNDGKAFPGSPITLSVNTTGPTAAVVPLKAISGFLALWLPMIGLVGTGVGLSSGRNKKRKVAAVMLASMLFGGLAFLVACGSSNSPSGGGKPGTPPGPYTITVTGVPNGAPTVSITTTLTVQ
jgi:probable HAF family extracellular repeat protein